MKLLWLFLASSFLAVAQVNNSPNMSLPIPIPGQTSGPQWAQDINASLTLIDQHNHTAGYGVQVPPAGININTSLPFNNNSATSMKASVYTPQGSYSTNYGVHVEGVDLYYVDGNGNDIKLTTGGAVNATSSGISSGTATASFAAGILVVNAASLTPANVKAGSYLMGNNSASSHYLTLAPPLAMGADYTITMPAIPGSQSFLTLDTSGNIAGSTAYPLTASGIANNAITATQIQNNTITATQIANATITTTQISATAGILPSQLGGCQAGGGSSSISSYTNATTSFSTIGNAKVNNAGSFTVTNGRPIIVSVTGNRLGGSSPGSIKFAPSAVGNFSFEIQVTKQSGATVVDNMIFSGVSPNGSGDIYEWPVKEMSLTDEASSTDASNNAITYQYQAKILTGTGTITVSQALFFACQM